MTANKPELLAPVGCKAHLSAAVNNGADAVYMGGMAFNARIFADNFSDEELHDAIRFAHLHGVKVYMTINTLIKDEELIKAFEYCNYIYGLGADAVIVQDMGLVRLLRKYLPALPVHLSTQATIYNKEALKSLKELGIDRIVPARECSIDEIEDMASEAAGIGIDGGIEVFVHGALCFCYSGQCQMSRVIGGGSGRTGNRGTCAQPCRQPYTDGSGNTTFALSPKDMCRIANLPEIIESGASSLKIEGRLKSNEYVAVVTGMYRKYIDIYDALVKEHGKEKAAELYEVDEADLLMLKQVFSRGDFSEGYLHGNPGDELLSGSSPKNQGVHLGRVIAVIDSEDKLSEPDEKAAARGALRRGKVLVFIEPSRAAKEQGIQLNQGDGIEFRDEDRDYLVNSPPGGVTTYLKDAGDGYLIAGDFDKAISAGDLIYKVRDSRLAEEALDAPEKKLPVTMSFTARAGQYAQLAMTDVKAGRTVEISADHLVERANRAATDEERIESSLKRLGDTAFDPGLTGIDIQIDDDIMMPLSVVNRMRRDAADMLADARIKDVIDSRPPLLSREELDNAIEDERLETSRLDLDDYPSLIGGRDCHPVDVELFTEEPGKRSDDDIPFILNVSKGRLDDYIRKNFDKIAEACKERGILIGNIGWIREFQDAGVKVYGDYGLNVYNEQARLLFEEMGVDLYLPSPETDVCDERGIALMITEHPIASEKLTDRKGREYSIERSESGDKTLIY